MTDLEEKFNSSFNQFKEEKDKFESLYIFVIIDVSKEEMDKALVLIDKYGITPAEQLWFYDLYNRVFKADKRPGCGKCFSNDAKIFRIKYKQIYN
jgi:hypothetical protein